MQFHLTASKDLPAAIPWPSRIQSLRQMNLCSKFTQHGLQVKCHFGILAISNSSLARAISLCLFHQQGRLRPRLRSHLRGNPSIIFVVSEWFVISFFVVGLMLVTHWPFHLSKNATMKAACNCLPLVVGKHWPQN